MTVEAGKRMHRDGELFAASGALRAADDIRNRQDTQP